ncbi:piggyBac transposable element-derived protein 2-like isoform X2 [Spodoptera litura]|uniref:PiggyBac transposable element-derived protein 2-like isoform X2 n=1 Tax=Spodoptera litura TaxID=69820 RepID=A0A9J7E7U9_SPOLT|nr:piggyBac transposable element-derived protein 2-like isoform X2 [Spodoptera litura]
MVYDFFPYDGANTFQRVPFTEWEENYLGVGGKTVVRLCKTISNKVLSTVYFDNWFTSLELLHYLRNEFGILSLGTIRKDRLRNCHLSSDKDMKKKGRGTYEVVCDNGKRLAVTKWVDNQCIHIASSFCAQDPVTTIDRYDKKEKRRVSVSCPHVVKVYNAHMGGVDIADMLTALYRIRMKTRRWYLSIFAQLLDIALNNSWLLHRRDCMQNGHENKLSLKKFRIQAALALMTTNTKSQFPRGALDPGPDTITKPFIPRPVDESRLDCFDHFPVYTSQGRCRLCKSGKTMVLCSKCEQRLCFTVKKNCFLLFHKNK